MTSKLERRPEKKSSNECVKLASVLFLRFNLSKLSKEKNSTCQNFETLTGGKWT